MENFFLTVIVFLMVVYAVSILVSEAFLRKVIHFRNQYRGVKTNITSQTIFLSRIAAVGMIILGFLIVKNTFF